MFSFIGFMFAFHYYVGHVMEGQYGTLEDAFVSMYRATIGDFDMRSFTTDENDNMGGNTVECSNLTDGCVFGTGFVCIIKYFNRHDGNHVQ
eukprot:UN24091